MSRGEWVPSTRGTHAPPFRSEETRKCTLDPRDERLPHVEALHKQHQSRSRAHVGVRDPHDGALVRIGP